MNNRLCKKTIFVKTNCRIECKNINGANHNLYGPSVVEWHFVRRAVNLVMLDYIGYNINDHFYRNDKGPNTINLVDGIVTGAYWDNPLAPNVQYVYKTYYGSGCVKNITTYKNASSHVRLLKDGVLRDNIKKEYNKSIKQVEYLFYRAGLNYTIL